MEQVSQARFADMVGCTRQNISRLIKMGRLPYDAQIKKIPLEAGLLAYRDNRDPTKIQNSSTPPIGAVIEEVAAEAQEKKSVAASVPGELQLARTDRERWQARKQELDVQQRMGLLLERNKVEDAMVSAGRRIRQNLDMLVGQAGEIYSLAKSGSEVDVRNFLRTFVRNFEQTIADAMIAEITDS